jgi:hypothetical protein
LEGMSAGGDRATESVSSVDRDIGESGNRRAKPFTAEDAKDAKIEKKTYH